MRTKEFKGKAIYSPKGKAGEYAKYAVNFYTGCSNGCEYCYCKRGVLKSVWSDKPRLKSCFKDEKIADISFFLDVSRNVEELQKSGVFFSFTTDPCLPETVSLTLSAVETCVDMNVPVYILTKVASEGLYEDLYLYSNRSALPQIAVGFTLTGHDELEPNASTNAERIAMMRRIHELGFKTFASIEPIIDIESSMRMMKKVLDCCDLFKLGLRSGVNKDYKGLRCSGLYSWLQRIRFTHDHCKFYLKDSIVKHLGIDRSTLPDNCVNTDYNIFLGN